MKSIARVSAIGLLLSGCAGGGAFVSVGRVDYAVLVKGLRCEVEEVMRYDRDSPDAGKFFFGPASPPRFASIVVKISGTFDRDASISAGIDAYGIGVPNTVTGSGSFGGAIAEYGEIIMGDNVLPDDNKCPTGTDKEYRKYRLGLLPWYKNISSRVENNQKSEYLSEMTYKRTGTISVGPNSATISFLSPGFITPQVGFSKVAVAEVTVIFTDRPSKATIALDQSSLEELARIIRSRGKYAGKSGGTDQSEKADRRRTGPTPAEVDRERQLEQLNENLKAITAQPPTILRLPLMVR